MGGAWSKWYLGLGTLGSDHPWLLAVLLISSLLNVAYLLPIPIRAFFAKPPGGKPLALSEAPVACLIAAGLTAGGSIALFFWVAPLLRLLEQVVP